QRRGTLQRDRRSPERRRLDDAQHRRLGRARQDEEVVRAQLDLGDARRVVDAQLLHELGAVALHAVQDLGGLTHTLDAGTLRTEAFETATDQLVELEQQLVIDLRQARHVELTQLASFRG